MTGQELADALVLTQQIEAAARAEWDVIAATDDTREYQVAMATVRQAGALRRALETWILMRATTGTTGRAVAAVGD